MKCIVCGNETFKLLHKGTRDNSEVDVMECEKCKSFQLSSFVQIKTGFYEDGKMHKNQYNALEDTYTEQEWDYWVNESKADDERRADMLQKILGKGRMDILDFGCGNGGFLRTLKERGLAVNVMGVELDKGARTHLLGEGIKVYESIDKMNESDKFDVITMFHVLEHLEEPQKILQKIRDRLSEDGLLVIETPNAADALISQYHSKSFMDFTFWSAHLFLYNTVSLEMLMDDCGFLTIDNGQIQRYPLANHLYWLSEGLPGGHVKWKKLQNERLNEEYTDMLRELHKCDTLFGVFRRKKDE